MIEFFKILKFISHKNLVLFFLFLFTSFNKRSNIETIEEVNSLDKKNSFKIKSNYFMTNLIYIKKKIKVVSSKNNLLSFHSQFIALKRKIRYKTLSKKQSNKHFSVEAELIILENNFFRITKDFINQLIPFLPRIFNTYSLN